MGDIDTAAVDSLKRLTPNGRLEKRTYRQVGFVPKAVMAPNAPDLLSSDPVSS